MKKLFLASQIKHPESMKKLEEFVGGLADKKIAYIPTAGNGEEPYGTWNQGETYNLLHKISRNVKDVVLEDYKQDESNSRLLGDIIGNDILYMAGGMSGYLLYWLRRFELEKEIPKMLDDGMIYVGSSAGSMVAAKTQYSGEWYIGESEPGSSIFPGLGLVDFEIYPHYEDKLLPEIKKHWGDDQGELYPPSHKASEGFRSKNLELYLLKDGEVIISVGGKVEVLGEKRILSNGELITK